MRQVFLDPDGTIGEFLAVIVLGRTGVVYASQCAGLRCQERTVEGYLVPLGGLESDPAAGRLNSRILSEVFHRNDVCFDNGGSYSDEDGRALLARLRDRVERVPFWTTSADGTCERVPLMLDESRLAEVVEAWVPVVTPNGPGVLVWDNCD